MSMALALGGLFVSSAIQTLVDQLGSHVLQHWGSESGLKDGMERLKITLLKIQPVIRSAERRIQTKPDGLVELLRALKDVAYDAEDLLDEFEYLRLKQKVEASEPLPSLGKRKRFDDAANQVSGFLSSQLSNAMGYLITSNDDDDDAANQESGCLPYKINRDKPSSSSSDDDTAATINKITERLESISAGVRDALKLVESDDDGWKQVNPVKKRETTSTLNEPEVYGRDKERDEIIEMLLDSGDESRSSSSKNVSVVSVVGIGGDGKTTLAQYVYNDERAKKYFESRVWVCVSDNFDAIRITREIIVSVSVSDERPHDLHQITSLDYLQRVLKEKLMGKKLLLVLDDVWDVKWKTLLPPLEAGENGSKVLVTSREEKVVDMKGKPKKILLKGLASGDYWSFFKKCAFGDEKAEDHPKLEWIGKQITKKLNGSPLAGKTLGALLNENLDDEHWTSILKSGIWELKQDEGDILPVLSLSYQHLPEHLQRCFAYCSVFPKDYEFSKNELIRIWMGQGFIPKEGNKNMEDIGSEYYHNLICRSFFLLENSYSTDYVLMHDLMHDLAQSVLKDECFRRIEGDESRKIPKTVRHLFVRTTHLTELQKNFEFKNLRTLLIFFETYDHDIDYAALRDLLKELQSIRVLILKNSYIKELPNVFGKLIHLRYLYLGGTCIRMIPESLCRLYHLQGLILAQSRRAVVPKAMTNLINLRHFTTPWYQNFSIPGIGKLSSLQQLRWSIENKVGHELKQLKDMVELRKLRIDNLENVEGKKESIEANLNEKRHLMELSLEWDSSRSGRPDVEEAVLEGLQPHPNLKKLTIEGYLGIRSPNWLEDTLLSNLESINLENCRNLKVLPPLGQLPFLKFLNLEQMEAIEHIDHTFYGSGDVKGFPSLQNLLINGMPKLKQWHGVEDCHLFPRICNLSILNCPKLRRLPNVGLIVPTRMVNNSSSSLSSSLSSSTIKDREGLLCLQEKGFRQPMSLKQLCVLDCPKLMLTEEGGGGGGGGLLSSSLVNLQMHNCDFSKSLPLHIQKITSLSTLGISGCPWLTSTDVMRPLTKLHVLRITNCEELTSLGVLQALVSLKDLSIRRCPKAYLTDDESLPSSLTGLNISGCGNLIKSLPRCLLNLTSLSYLEIQDCPLLTSTEMLFHLTTLNQLAIENCEGLASLHGLQALISLKYLTIKGCPNLTTASLVPEEEAKGYPSLSWLTIDNTSLLVMSPLKKCLRSLRCLYISDCSQLTLYTGEECLQNLTSLKRLVIRDSKMKSLLQKGLPNSLNSLILQNCKNLQSLPTELQSLSSLETLEIQDCPEIKSLPEKGLPTSLRKLQLYGTNPMLKERCQEGGADWDKIAHIPDVELE